MAKTVQNILSGVYREMSEVTRWNTIVIKVPDEMLYRTKTGILKIAPPVTKRGNIAKRTQKPSVQIETAPIEEPQIVKKGIRTSREDLKGQSQRQRPSQEMKDVLDTKFVEINRKEYRPNKYVRNSNFNDGRDYKGLLLDTLSNSLVGWGNPSYMFEDRFKRATPKAIKEAFHIIELCVNHFALLHRKRDEQYLTKTEFDKAERAFKGKLKNIPVVVEYALKKSKPTDMEKRNLVKVVEILHQYDMVQK